LQERAYPRPQCVGLRIHDDLQLKIHEKSEKYLQAHQAGWQTKNSRKTQDIHAIFDQR